MEREASAGDEGVMGAENLDQKALGSHTALRPESIVCLSGLITRSMGCDAAKS